MEVEKKTIVNSFFYILPKFAGMAVHVITLPILTRILTPQDFGVVTMATIFPTFAVGVFSWGMPSAVQRFFFEYRKEPDRLGQFLFTCQLFLYLSLFVTAVPVFFCRNSLSRMLIGDEGYGKIFFIYYISLFLLTIFNVYLTTLQNFENAKTHSFFSIFHAVFLSALNVLLCLALKNYTALVYASLISSFVASTLGTLYFMKHFKKSLSLAMLKESLLFGVQSIPKSFTGFVGKFFDKFMLNKSLTLQAVGVYNIGQSLGNASFSFMNAIWSSFQPPCYRQVFDQGEKASGPVGRLFSYFLFTTSCPLLAFLLFSPEIIRLLAPPTYRPAVDVIMIVLCAMSTNIFGMFVGVQFAYMKRPLYIFFVTIVGTLVNVGMNILLVPRYGLMGASVAMLGSYVTINALLTVMGQFLYKIRFEWGFVFCVYAIFMLSTASGILMRAMDASYASQLFLKIVLLSCLFFAGYHWKVATPDTLRKIVRLLKSKNSTDLNLGAIVP
ncbi:MAG: oligosaccharide flippase family protein [Elusimicrobia bacterium]|nr:oligosaccharide flippase family protein [Elusimicrobiota bacterium]